MHCQGLVVAVGLALVVADSAMGADLLPVTPPAIPSLPSVDPSSVLPPVSAPAVPLPSVSQPPPGPSLPAPEVPALPGSSGAGVVPSGVLTQGGSSSGTARSGATSGGGPAARGVTPARGASRTAVAARSGARRTGGDGPARGVTGGIARRAMPVADPQRARRQRAERRLQVTVKRLSGCLGDLPSLERRVLVLRAGVGSAEPRSRARVARTLDLRGRTVARAERRGLRRLRALARAGRCGADADDGAAVNPAAALRELASAPLAAGPLGVLLARGLTQSRGHVEVKGEQQSGGAEPAAAPPRTAPDTPALPAPVVAAKRAGGAVDLMLVLLALVALVGVALVAKGARSTLKPPDVP